MEELVSVKCQPAMEGGLSQPVTPAKLRSWDYPSTSRNSVAHGNPSQWLAALLVRVFCSRGLVWLSPSP